MSLFTDILKSTFIKEPSNDFFTKSVAPGMFNFITPDARPPMKSKEFQLAYRGWVFACVNAIAERLADIDLQLQFLKGKDWVNVDVNDSLQLLHYVNPFMSFTELMFSYGAYQELDGNAYWYIPKNGASKPGEIWALNPAQITVVKSSTEFISGYVYKNDQGTDVPLDPDEIVPFKRFNPRDPYRGVGTVQAAGIAIDIDQFAAEWQRNFFGNSALPSGLLYSENTMTQDQYDRIKANWDAKYKGVENAHKLGIVEGGMKYQQLTPSSRDMQFTEGRQNIRDEILAIFRVPKTILGITEDVNLASAQATEYIFAKYVIKPKMKAFVETLNEYYLPLFKMDPAKCRFNFTDPVPENNEDIRMERESNLKNNIITINEARAEEGREPIEGGDVLYVLNTMIPITDAGKAVAPAPEDPSDSNNEPDNGNTDKDEDDGNNEDPEDKGVKKNFKKITQTKDAQQEEKDYKKEQIKLLNKIYLDLNKKLQDIVVNKIKQQKRVTTNIIIAKAGAVNDVINFIVDSEEFNGWMKIVYNTSKDNLTKILKDSGQATLANLNLETDFDLQNPQALDWINDHALEDSNSYSGTWKDDIALQVQQGLEQGLTNEKIADNVNDYFFDETNMRAMRIARTETINAYSAGNLEGYKQSGVVSGKYWVADGEACPICQGNEDDGTIGLDEDFSSGDSAPTAHPNCECSLGGATDANA